MADGQAHSRFGASAAKRWLNCPGSVQLAEDLPDEGSDDAALGTAAHKLGERCLREEREPIEFLGETILVGNRAFEVDVDMTEAVGVYTDTVRGILERHHGQDPWLQIEVKVQLDHLHPELWGTADTAILANEDLYVLDYKNGAGVVVEVTDNEQAKFYALGVLRDLERRGFRSKPKRVHLGIVQPNAHHPDGRVRWWETTPAELEAFGRVLQQGVVSALSTDAYLQTGDWCRFCPARLVCPALQKLALDEGLEALDEADLRSEGSGPVQARDPINMTPEQIARALSLVTVIEAWLHAVRGRAMEMLEAGGKIPGWKLVPKRAVRKWIDDELAVSGLRDLGLGDDQIFKRELISPAQAEKAVGKRRAKDLAPLYAAVSSGHNMAPEADERPALEDDRQALAALLDD